MKNINCYIHIPFCKSKCKYCRFASFSGLKDISINNYVDFLCKEIEEKKDKNIILDTIYFGGGNPGILDLEQNKKIFSALKKSFNFSKNIEISLETTPDNIDEEKIIGWKSLGINRLSIGVQTLNEKALKEIGRSEKKYIINALDNIKSLYLPPVRGNYLEEGIAFSLDFILGLPYVEKKEVLNNIDFLIKKYDFIKHISLYMLEEYYEIPEKKKSKFDNITYPNNWKDNGLKEDEYLGEYKSIKKYLKDKGFDRYEISNFAKSGYECKHNRGYWTHKENISFGLGAHGFLENIRFSNSENFLDYYAKKNTKLQKLNQDDIFIEGIMFDLRTSGIDIKKIRLLDKKSLDRFLDLGYLEKKDDKIILSDKGVLVLDYILAEIL